MIFVAGPGQQVLCQRARKDRILYGRCFLPKSVATAAFIAGALLTSATAAKAVSWKTDRSSAAEKLPGAIH